MKNKETTDCLTRAPSFAEYKGAADRLRCGKGTESDTAVCDAWDVAMRAKAAPSKAETLLDLPIGKRFFMADHQDSLLTK